LLLLLLLLLLLNIVDFDPSYNGNADRESVADASSAGVLTVLVVLVVVPDGVVNCWPAMHDQSDRSDDTTKGIESIRTNLSKI
jgi:hypothetical protein